MVRYPEYELIFHQFVLLDFGFRPRIFFGFASEQVSKLQSKMRLYHLATEDPDVHKQFETALSLKGVKPSLFGVGRTALVVAVVSEG